MHQYGKHLKEELVQLWEKNQSQTSVQAQWKGGGSIQEQFQTFVGPSMNHHSPPPPHDTVEGKQYHIEQHVKVLLCHWRVDQDNPTHTPRPHLWYC